MGMKRDGRMTCLMLAMAWLVLVGIVVIFILTR